MALPDNPNLDWLRKQAKRRLTELRASNAQASLTDAQLDLAREHGFASWRALKAHIDEHSIDGRLFAAAESGDVPALESLLGAHPARLEARNKAYGHTLLHVAAFNGHLAAVDVLLRRGIDPNVRERGDNTYPMHWAAASGHLEVVRRLADAGGDVIGAGDDHALEVIGWASCFGHHREVADFLVQRGARHHIFSAIALGLDDEVRRIVRAVPAALSARMSRNENHQTPLHFAVREGRTRIVDLLLELGADPLVVDGAGFDAFACAESADADRSLMKAVRALTAAELVSAERGARRANISGRDLMAALALGEWDTAERLARDAPALVSGSGLLHLMAKRNDAAAVRWLLAHGADPNALWAHWDAEVVPLHLAVLAGHPGIVQLLLQAGASSAIHDSKHDSDPAGWALFFLNNARDRRAERQECVNLLLGNVVESAADQPMPEPEVPEAAAAPEFEEQFTDKASLARNWIAHPAMTVRGGGLLSFAPRADAGFCLGVSRRDDFRDCVLTVDFRIIRSAVGVVLRANGPDRYYMIQFDLANGPAVVWFHTFTPDAEREYRVERVKSRQMPVAGKWHRMRIVARGHRFDVFLGEGDGPLAFCARWEDAAHTYEQGAIGFWEHGGEVGEYRRLRVNTLGAQRGEQAQ